MQRCQIAVSLVLPFLLLGRPSLQRPNRDLLDDVTVKPSSGQVTAVRSASHDGAGLAVKIAPGTDAYPGINLTPIGGPWNLSSYGHVEATIANTGSKPISVSLRVDNAGNWQDNPWNAETVFLQAGQTSTITTMFGFSYGHKRGFALKPGAIVNLVIFAAKSDEPQSFLIKTLTAGGQPSEKPPVAPDDKRIKPKDGVLFTAAGSPPGSTNISAVRPPEGRWDLSDYTQVILSMHNSGAAASSPKVRLETNGGNSDWVSPIQPIQPGSDAEIVVPFFHAINLNETPAKGLIASDAVSAVAFSGPNPGLDLKSATASVGKPTMPSWLGQRPPVPGDWIKTLDQTFKNRQLDRKIWRDVGENYYDKVSHWSKNEIVFENGLLKLRYEKKTGFQNDDSKRNSTPYAAGYLDTYGLWVQRYGYFEARMKVPAAPGLWPAFWMMPDRGTQVEAEQWKRQDTANGGMEFDIMEHLSRWGTHRFNIAMHYDGYQKDHKQLGSDKIYVEPDKDGFITCGLLWTPGLAVYYYNGREVLRWSNPRISNVPSILMFTMPMGGWDNNDLDDTQLPADLVVDYVRVWQRKDLAGGK